MSYLRRFFSNIIYDILIGILALISVVIAIYDLSKGIQSLPLAILDKTIWILFIADYIIRIFTAEDKKDFFKNNILDLIAILPFNSILRGLRLIKLTRLVKLSKLTKLSKFIRLSTFISRVIKKCKNFLNTNGFKYILTVCIAVIFLGAIGIHYAENMNFSDAIWWSFVTTTTVGYGDISPASPFGRIIACILMIVGIGLIGSLTSTITAFFFYTSQQKKSFKQTEIDNIKTALDNIDDLTAEDIEDICKAIRSLKY